VDPVPDPLLLRKSGSVGNRTQTPGSVARNSDHQTTEAVNRQHKLLKNVNIKLIYFLEDGGRILLRNIDSDLSD
jgi:hypothetical protein